VKHIVKIIIVLLILGAIGGIGFYISDNDFKPILPHGTKLSEDDNTHNTSKTVFTKDFEENIHLVLKQLEVKNKNIHIHYDKKNSIKKYSVGIPRGLPFELIVYNISQCTNPTPYAIKDSFLNTNKKECVLTFTSKKDLHPVIMMTLTESDYYYSDAARIAFVIENFIFNADSASSNILSFDKPLTIGLNPNDPRSSWTSSMVEEYKKEIIIQLPMEPVIRPRGFDPDNTIMIHHDEKRIRQFITSISKSLSAAVGYTNMMGSRACTDSRVMNIICDEIGKQQAYFLESNQGSASVAQKYARINNIKYAKIESEIDTRKQDELEKHLKHLCFVALRTGSIIVSADNSAVFIPALSNVLEYLHSHGIRLVYVSNLVKNEF